jgi:hypothetical protein
MAWMWIELLNVNTLTLHMIANQHLKGFMLITEQGSLLQAL